MEHSVDKKLLMCDDMGEGARGGRRPGKEYDGEGQ